MKSRRRARRGAERVGRLGWLRTAAILLAACQAVSGFCAAFHGPAPAASTHPAGTNSAFNSALNIRQAGSNVFEVGLVVLDGERRTLTLPARVRLRDEVVEYALVTEQGKGYESIFTTAARPTDIHVAALLLGLGTVPLAGQLNTAMEVPGTNSVQVLVSWKTNGLSRDLPLASLVQVTAGKPDRSAPELRLDHWLYNGSVLNSSGFAAQTEGSIISLIRDPVALLNNPGADRDRDTIHFPNARLLPPTGTPVRITIQTARPVPAQH